MTYTPRVVRETTSEERRQVGERETTTSERERDNKRERDNL